MKNENDLKQAESRAIEVDTVLAAGWISVKKKLPKTVSDYLVTDGTACMVAAFRVEKKEWDFWTISWWSSEQVTHWMPLPSLTACR